MLLLYFLRYSLPKNILEQNKEVYTENVSYGYIFCWTTRKYYYEKMKEHNWKKRILEKSWMKFILLSLFFCDCETVICSVLFTAGEAVQLTWYGFSTYLHQ